MARQTLRGVRNEHCLVDLVSDEEAMAALMASPDPPLHCLLQVQTHERLFRGEKDQKWFERADDMFLDFSACRAVLNTPIPFAVSPGRGRLVRSAGLNVCCEGRQLSQQRIGRECGPGLLQPGT